MQTFVKHENRGLGYAFKLIQHLMNEIPLSLKDKAKFCLGETASLFLFRSLMLKGILSDINFIDETVKLKLSILDTYIFCKKHNLNIKSIKIVVLMRRSTPLSCLYGKHEATANRRLA